MDAERKWSVVSLVAEYVKSPSLRHLREPRNLHALADQIVRAIDQKGSIWSKWEGQRVTVAKAAWPCWIPTDDLRAYLNELPGPQLTLTDVAQRLRAFWEEGLYDHPDEGLKAACLEIYEREKSAGTEMPAIIGAIQEYIELEQERLRIEREETYRANREEERERLKQRFLAGADGPWTPVDETKSLYCRKNGRAYRIQPTNDKRWKLFRIENVSDEGKLLGTYAQRGDANKALKTLSVAPEPRW